MQLITTLKLIARNIFKPRPDLRIKTSKSKIWLGIDSAGFFVHLPTLNKDSVVYSFGIGEDITFDRHLIEKTGCKVFAFDPTPKSIHWLSTQVLPDGFVAHPAGISPETGKMKFRLPKNKDHVSGSLENAGHVNDSDTVEVDVKRLSDLMRDLGHRRIDLLKMDIEGSEYGVIDQILDEKVEIGQLVVEVHERYLPEGKMLTEKMVKKLQKNGYQLFAKSLSREELSFIKM